MPNTPSESADLLLGSGAADSIAALGGNDTIVGGAGNDTFDGGTGIDTALYIGGFVFDPAAPGSITTTATGWQVAAGADGTDQLTNVEIVVAGGRVLLVGNGGYATIQDAVDAAVDGDTILIAAGTYAEQVVVDGKSGLTIIGAPGANLLPPAGTDPFETTFADPVTGRETYAVLSIVDSTSVTVRGLTIDGDGQAGRVTGGANYVGVLAFDSSVAIEDTTITGIRDPLVDPLTVSGAQRGVGILVANVLGSPQDFSFTGNTIADYQKNAMVVRNADVDISDNTITGSGPQAINGQNGVQLSHGSTGAIVGNTISGIGYAGPQDVTAVSILIFDSVGGLEITDNDVTGVAGPNDTGIYLIDSTDVVASGNTLSGFNYGAIDLASANDLAGTTDLSGNDYSDNVVNIGFYPRGTEPTGFAPVASDGPDELFGGAGEDTLAGLNGDDHLDGGEGNDQLLGGQGADSLFGGGGNDSLSGGPGGDAIDGGEGNDTLLYVGLLPDGGAVSGTGDDAGSWIVNGDTLSGVELVANDDGSRVLLVGNGGYATIQDAVDDALDGDTVLIADGVYFEQVTITTSGIRLLGESRDGVIIRSPAIPAVQGQHAPWIGEEDVAAVVAVIGVGGVTIENLTVDGDSRLDEAFGAGANDFFGILYLRSSGNVDSVTVQGVIGDNGFFGVQAGEGIGVLADYAPDDYKPTTDRQTFVLTDSTVTGFQKTGVLVYNTDLTATGNLIEGVGNTTGIAQNGFQLSRNTAGAVNGNTISGIGYTGPAAPGTDASAIFVGDSVSGLTIRGNTLTAAAPGNDTGIFVGDSRNVVVGGAGGDGNTIQDFDIGVYAYDGLYPEPPPGFDADWDPTRVNGGNTVLANTVTGTATGVVVDADAFDAGLPTGAFTLRGGAADDSLFGALGADTLDGGTGADRMTGRGGNDVYLVDNAGDAVVELAAGGTDRVDANLSVTALAAQVENLTLLGTGDLSGTGNGLANVITGNIGNNVVTGGADNDTLIGGSGNDTLVGGADADRLEGGLGNDRYVIGDNADTVVELLNQGLDTVEASLSFSLNSPAFANVENLALAAGTAGLQGTGNALNNVIQGNAGANRLEGLGGNDTLIGGAGRDTLVGGGKDDRFVFNSLSESGTTIGTADLIASFTQSQDDRIDVSAIDAIDGGPDNSFTLIGSSAFSAAGQVRYFFDNGKTVVQFSTDADAAAEMVIRINGTLTLTASDFLF